MGFKRKYSNWGPDAVEREAEEWFASDYTREHKYTTPTNEIEVALSTDISDPNSLGGEVAFNLEMLCMWYVHVGELGISRSESDGWCELKRALRYQYWSIRTLVRLWELDTRRRKQARVGSQTGSLYFALAVTTGSTEEAAWLGERMSRSRQDGAFGSWDYGPLPSFLLTLFLRSQGDTDALVVPPTDGLEVYSDVFEHWSNDKLLAEAIRNIADYHLDHTCESDEDFIEFTMSPFIHVPVEVITLERIRAGLGLTTPRIEHELFSTPFCQPPDKIDDIDDPFLDRVIAFVTDAIDA
jgi:hypothetical protein